MTSPEHNFKIFKLSGWTITRFALRDSPSAVSDRETVNLGTDICLVNVIVIEDWTCTCVERAVIFSEVSDTFLAIAGHSSAEAELCGTCKILSIKISPLVNGNKMDVPMDGAVEASRMWLQ